MSTIKWGVLSTGRIAHQFAQDLAHVDRAELLGVTSRTRSNAEAFAGKFGVGTVYSNYEELLANPAIDAVYIATPHSLHYSNTLGAIAAGKAVLCEKPLVTNVADCEGLVEAARGSSVYLMEAMWTWFLPAIRVAVQWYREGRVGRLVQIKADFGYPQRPYAPDRREYDAGLGGGALLEMGIYPVALLWLFLRRQPERVLVSSRRAPNGVEDDVSAILEYEECTAVIGTSFRCKLQNWAYLIGEDGYIAIPDFWRARECFLYQTDERVDAFRDDRESIGLSFETQAVVDDLLAKRSESEVVPLDYSIEFQRTMARIRAGFSAPDRR